MPGADGLADQGQPVEREKAPNQIAADDAVEAAAVFGGVGDIHDVLADGVEALKVLVTRVGVVK